MPGYMVDPKGTGAILSTLVVPAINPTEGGSVLKLLKWAVKKAAGV